VVSWSKIVVLVPPLLVLAGCDPFAPSNPESPSNTREAVVAGTPADVERELGHSFTTRDPLLWGDVTGETLRLVQSGDSLANSAFLKCVQNGIFGATGDTAAIVWKATYAPDAGASVADVVVAKVDYSITKGSATKIFGVARWTISDVNTLGWELVRWEDLSESKSGLFAYCKGGEN
jgi:hypothetical protein